MKPTSSSSALAMCSRLLCGAAAVWLLAQAGATDLRAQTLEAALAQAYGNNPTLNAQRAAVRATDENVPQALSGYRPRVTATADAGRTDSNVKTVVAGVSSRQDTLLYPRGAGLTISQPIFDGFRTGNTVRQAEATILAARQSLRNAEQQTLFQAVQAYMNVLRDFALHDLQRNNVELLDQQLLATRQRFDVGEVTRTDVAQSESRLAAARSAMVVAEANLNTSRAVYRQSIGAEPGRLMPARPVDRLLPPSVDSALGSGYNEHPAILAALHNVDAALYRVKVLEGALLPSVTVDGSVTSRFDVSTQTEQSNSASIVGRLTVPIYQGGTEYSQVRQAKETLGQRRIEADLARDQVRAAVVSAWGLLEGAKGQIIAAQAQVAAAQVAFSGVSEEVKVGQRTTLDVLNAQQELLNARTSLITAQRDRVVASYALLQAVGRLSAGRLNLRTANYDPKVHYDQVRDKWIGLRTPDGR